VLDLLVVSACLALFFWSLGDKRIDRLRIFFRAREERVLLIPAAATALWAFIAITHDRFSPIALLLIAEYFFIPALLLKLSRKEFLKYEEGQKIQLTDTLAILAIWFPFDFRITKPAWQLDVIILGEEVGYFLNVLVSFVYTVVIFRAYRGIDIGFRWKTNAADIKTLALYFLGLVIPLAIITLATGLTSLGLTKRPELIPILLVGGFFHPALSEELLFRGLFQNMLVKRIGAMAGIIVVSVLFGLGYINNHQFGFHYPNWPFVGLATVAGIGYGLIYHKRKSLALAAELHIMVDFTHWVFFGGK